MPRRRRGLPYPPRRRRCRVPRESAAVPEDDAKFTAWYRRHVKRFFGVSGAEYDRLFGLHGLEHKSCGEPARTRFDGLICDGSGNYLKLLREGDGWKVADFKARSFKREAKAILAPWIVKTCVGDRYEGPPPITESPTLLGYKDANRVARKALQVLEEGAPRPNGRMARSRSTTPWAWSRGAVLAYKLIKTSAFLFRTPRQREKFEKAMKKFADSTGCGLEALSLRRGGGGRRKCSIADVAEAIYRLVRAGEENPVKALEPDAFLPGTRRGPAYPPPGARPPQGRGRVAADPPDRRPDYGRALDPHGPVRDTVRYPPLRRHVLKPPRRRDRVPTRNPTSGGMSDPASQQEPAKFAALYGDGTPSSRPWSCRRPIARPGSGRRRTRSAAEVMRPPIEGLDSTSRAGRAGAAAIATACCSSPRPRSSNRGGN